MTTPHAYLPLAECIHRGVYRVHARSFRLAVYDDSTKSFFGIRTKFGRRFIDNEEHWDAPEFATCKPLELVCMLPDEIELASNNAALFAWLEEQEKRE